MMCETRQIFAANNNWHRVELDRNPYHDEVTNKQFGGEPWLKNFELFSEQQ